MASRWQSHLGDCQPPGGPGHRRRRVLGVGLAAALAACGQATMGQNGPRPFEPWRSPADVAVAQASACAPTPPEQDEAPAACAELGQLPEVLAAAAACTASGGTYHPGRAGCRCPPGHWQRAGGGCGPRAAARASGPACRGVDMARAASPRARRARAHCLRHGRIQLGGLGLATGAQGGAALQRTAEALFPAAEAGAPDADLLDLWLPAGAEAGDERGGAVPGWWAGDDLGRLMAPALENLSAAAWRAAPAPRLVMLWRDAPHPHQKDTALQQHQGRPQGRCRAALARLGLGPEAEPPGGHPCAQLARLRDGLREAQGSQGAWRRLSRWPDTPTAGLSTVVGHLDGAPAGHEVQWLMADGVVVQRRLHLWLPEVAVVAFVDDDGRLLATAAARPPAAAGDGGPAATRAGPCGPTGGCATPERAGPGGGPTAAPGGAAWRAFDRRFRPLPAAAPPEPVRAAPRRRPPPRG